MAKIKIRKINPKDIDAIYKLGLEQFKGEFWYKRRFLTDTIKTDGLYFGAFLDNKIVGTIFVRLYDPPKSWVYFFVVGIKYRRKGIGQLLIEKIQYSLPKEHFLLLVDLEDSDTSGKKFYIKNRFRRVAKIPDWFGENTYGVLYWKKISKKA